MYNIFDPEGDYNNLKSVDSYRDVIEQLAKQFTCKSSVTDVGVVYKNKKFYRSGNHSCHAGLCVDDYYGGDENKTYKKTTPYYIVSSLQNSHDFMKKEDIINFINYLVNRSMYADAFIDKDANQIYNQGYYLIDANMPNNVNCGAAMATRFISESQNGPGARVFCHMINKEDIDPNYLFTFSHVFGSSLKSSLYPIIAGPRDSHNGYRISRATPRSVNNMSTNNRVFLSKNYTETNKYSDIAKLWGSEEYLYDGHTYDACRRLTPHVKVDNINFNIFALKSLYKKDSKEVYLTDDDSLMNVYEQYVKMLKSA